MILSRKQTSGINCWKSDSWMKNIIFLWNKRDKIQKKKKKWEKPWIDHKKDKIRIKVILFEGMLFMLTFWENCFLQ